MGSLRLTFCLVMFCITMFRADAIAAGNFRTYASFPITHASDVAKGDFTGSGRSDLAFIDEGNKVWVLLQNADGSFAGPVKYQAGVHPHAIAVGDVNGDGKLDIIVANNGNPKISEFGSIGILLGKGDGTFRKAIQVGVGAVYPTWLAVADLNGDGELDVVLRFSNLMLTVYLGEGNGKFKAGETYPAFTVTALGDFNNDGNPDLLQTNDADCRRTKNCEVSVQLGNGDGTFHAAQTTALPFWLANTRAIVADFNNDGKQDLLVGSGASGDGELFFLSGNGDGTFAAPVYENVNGPIASVAADFNGDGNLDLVMGFVHGKTIALGNGDGTFRNPTIGYDLGSSSPASAGVFEFNGKAGVVSLNSVDVGVALGNGDASLEAGQIQYLAGDDSPVISVDFNHDGKADIVWNNEEGTLQVALGNGNGSFTLAGDCFYPNGGLALRAADFNHDKNVDLIAAAGKQDLEICPGNGDGTFQEPMAVFTGGGSNELDIADFNGDGNLDLVVPTGGLVNIVLGNGDGTFQSPYNQALNTNATYVIAVDVNGDGKQDLVIEGSQTYVALGEGNGKFKTAKAIAPAGASVRAGDFNKDGKEDLAIMNSNGTVTVMLGNGDGTFQAGKVYGSGFTGQWILRDVNLDENIDIVAVTKTGFSVLAGNGDGTFQSAVAYPVTYDYAGVPYLTSGDFNNDHKPDLFISTLDQSILLFNSTGD